MSAQRLPHRKPPAARALPIAGAAGPGTAVGAAPHPGLRSAPAAAPVLLRPARLADVPELAPLIAEYAARGLLLPRSPEQLARDIDSFTVAVDGHGVVACGSLRRYTPTLAEVCALAVAERMQGRGIGRAIVESIVEEAERAGIRQLFALTLEEKFFNRLGFRTGRIADVPEKVWADCEGCPVRHACREIMVVRDLESAS